MLDVNQFICFDPLNSDVSNLPSFPGNYVVVLRLSCQLPAISIKPIALPWKWKGKEFDVIYTGISKNLKVRDYKQHFIGNNAGKSTLRKSLGCLMGLKQIPRDNLDNGKTKFSAKDEFALSKWMAENLLLFYFVNDEYEDNELELIKTYNPPLNLQHNDNFINREFRKKLSSLRSQRNNVNSYPFVSNNHLRKSVLSNSIFCEIEKNRKGRNKFTKEEKSELIKLIDKKCNLSSVMQKKYTE